MHDKQPILDLKPQYQKLRQEIKSVIDEVLESQHFILGKFVQQLERGLQEYLKIKHVIGVSSGTDALLVSLMALDIKSGDEVMTTPFTFFATAGCIARVGAKPVFVDIEFDTFNINPDLIKKAITRKTKAIIPVHLFGHSCDMDRILEIAKEYNLAIIEDCAQAIGETYRSRMVGGFGRVGCFSFYPTKNLGGYGDGGFVATDDDNLAEKIRALRVHGTYKKYHYRFIGGNFRLDEIQAAVLCIKLKYIEEWNEQRRQKARVYNALFEKYQLLNFVKLPSIKPYSKHVFHQYTIGAKKRDALKDFLMQKGILTDIYYPVPLHLQECFSYLGYKGGDFPVSEQVSNEVLSLPIYPELTQKAQEFVVGCIAEFYKE